MSVCKEENKTQEPEKLAAPRTLMKLLCPQTKQAKCITNLSINNASNEIHKYLGIFQASLQSDLPWKQMLLPVSSRKHKDFQMKMEFQTLVVTISKRTVVVAAETESYKILKTNTFGSA